MRTLALSAALASLVALTGCGDDAEDTAATPSSQAPAASSAPSGSAAPSAPSGSSGATTALTGTVGTDDDPDAFVITLTDAAGKEVTTLPAGQYTIQVKDPSKIHNFHLEGPGVDETTTVAEVVDTTFDVTLAAGSYRYVCDPHPRMVGELTVT